MSEAVTYADLNFQDSNKTENIQKFDKGEIRAPPAPPHAWRHRALALTALCLLLLIGLGVLGSIFYVTLNIEMGRLNELQNFTEELQRNVSLQLEHNMDSSKKIRDLSVTLQKIATKLCHELYSKEPEHKCKPCPKEWLWLEDSCYLFLPKDSKTWQESNRICSAENASLLKIKSESVLEFIKSQELSSYWLGLSPSKYKKDYHALDDIIVSSDWFVRNTNDLNGKMYCGYIYYEAVYYAECTNKNRIICEKLADSVQIDSTLHY
ncbi:C-type lectin domain family 12 member A-like [Manis pentadactyla]|uniref:C-type lectin domain family 12 member A-like n=1 Tax=Manis pentadactyla TaxID=143292 RepID=UPI00255CE78B|nr:C-type lectin domain family 12 member A-like [Manis pentadactyla]